MGSFKLWLERKPVWVQQVLVFGIVSLFGTCFSFPLYLLLRSEGYGAFLASPISNIVAQAIDFFPHKLLSFKERRLEGRVLSSEALLYAAVALLLMIVEPALLYTVEQNTHPSPLIAWLAVHPLTGTTRFVLYRMIFKKYNGRTTPGL